MAATLIDDQVQSKLYDISVYPKFSEIDASEHMVSELTRRLLSRMIKSKRRQIAISYSKTAAALPQSSISPIILPISVYVNSKCESRELIELLSSLGFADDYREVLRLYDALLPTDEKEHGWVGSLVSFVFDNADIDTRTLTGLWTWHAMSGVIGITPARDHVEPQLPRSFTVRSAVNVGRFADIPLRRHTKPSSPGLKQVCIGPAEPPDPDPPILKFATSLDTRWLASYFVSDPKRCS